MQIIRDLREITPELHGCIMTIGNFDGVHSAHQTIIRKVVAEAKDKNRKSVVMTFEPHPQQVLRPDRIPFYLISTLEEKMEALASLEVDAAVVISFDLQFAATTAETFVRDVICGKLRPQKVLIGHDYTFGKGKQGKPEYLREMGKVCDFEVEVFDAVLIGEDIVSSTRIRNAVLEGRMEDAALLLGRPYTLAGTVVKGFRRGGDIGFPTANLQPDKELIPPEGVYAVWVELDGEKHRGVTNIGFNPTFANENLSVEIHLLDFRGDLYGKKMKVLFVRKLRDERKFQSIEGLVAQIKADIDRAREILR